MKVDKDGRIAYHSYRMREDGGLDFVQYDFDGSIDFIREERPVIKIEPKELSFWERLTYCP